MSSILGSSISQHGRLLLPAFQLCVWDLEECFQHFHAMYTNIIGWIQKSILAYLSVISPRQNSHKVTGAGGMEQGLNVPKITLKCLELHASTDTQNLLDLDVAAQSTETLRFRMHKNKTNNPSQWVWRRYATCPAAGRSHPQTLSCWGERSQCCTSEHGTSPGRRARGFS